MSSDDLGESGAETEIAISSIKTEVAYTLGLQEQEITDVLKATEFFEGRSRFAYFFTSEGFGKIANSEHNDQLRRENQGLDIARELGIPVPNVLKPYLESAEGHGILYLKQFKAEDGTILNDEESIAATDPAIATRIAKSIAQATVRQIPSHSKSGEPLDTSLLKRGDVRNASAEGYWNLWKQNVSIILDPEYKEEVDQLTGTEELSNITLQTQALIEKYINNEDYPDNEYFIHNDMSPSNTFIPDSLEEPVIFLDFEHAGATHNQTLGILTDLGNFYGRLWPNPEMQKQFLVAFLQESPTEKLDYNYALTRTIAVQGTLFLAKYAMKPDHPEHEMSVRLLSSIKGNLESLDQQYKLIKEQS